jgi:hypothetical protein
MKHYYRWMVLFLLLVGAAFPAAADDRCLLVVSAGQAYIGGNGAVFHDGAVTQDSLDCTIAQSGGWNLGTKVWVSEGLAMPHSSRDLSGDYGDEIDLVLHAAQKFPLATFEVGMSYIDVVGLGEVPNGDVLETYVRASRPFIDGWSGSVQVENYLPGGVKVQGGWLAHARLRYDWKHSGGERLPWLGFYAEGGPSCDDGAFGFRSGCFASIDAGAPITLGKATLIPSWKRVSPLGNLVRRGDSRRARSLMALAIVRSF